MCLCVRCCFLQQCCLEQLSVLGCRKNRKLNAQISCHKGKPRCTTLHTRKHIIMNVFHQGQFCVNDCVAYVWQVQVRVCVTGCSASAIARLLSVWRLHTSTIQSPPHVPGPAHRASVNLILQHNQPVRTPVRRAMKGPHHGLN